MQSLRNQHQQGNDQNVQTSVDLNSGSKSNTKRVLLRLKRRRGAPLPETLCINPTNLEDSSSSNEHDISNINNRNKRFRSRQHANNLQGRINQLKSDAYLSHMMMNMTTMDAASPSAPSAASTLSEPVSSIRPIVFKRFTQSTTPNSNSSTESATLSNKKRKNDLVRVVDCLHEDEKEADAFLDDDRLPQTKTSSAEHRSELNPSRKRPRISILQTQKLNYHELLNKTTTSKSVNEIMTAQKSPSQTASLNLTSSPRKKKRTPILSPIMSLVDSQLKLYHESGPGLSNPNLSYMHFLQSVILPSSSSSSKSNSNTLCKTTSNPLSPFLNHACSNGMGTVLHGTSLWNDVEGASQFVFSGNIDIHIQDSDGRTALDVAQMCGHASIVRILQKRLGEVELEELKMKEEKEKAFKEEQDFVYDLYYMDVDEDQTKKKDEVKTGSEVVDNKTISSKDGPTVKQKEENDYDEMGAFVELSNGIGYWDPNGDLIFETLPEVNENMETANEEDDYDSNDEGFVGNDYPEEEEYEEEGYYTDDEVNKIGRAHV